MEKDKEVHPRVRIVEKKAGLEIGVNFSKSISNGLERPESLDGFLELAGEWTSHNVAMLKFIPAMTSTGFFLSLEHLNEDVIKLLDELCISSEISGDVEKEGKVSSYILHEEDLNQVAIKMEINTQILKAAHSIQRSTLSSLIAEFDFFFLRFLEQCARYLPEKFTSDTDVIKLKDISPSDTVEEIRQKVFKAKIEKKLRDSHSDSLRWFFEKFDIKYPKDDPIFRDFIQVCQTRHILVHNGGIVNKQYIDRCVEAGFERSQLPSDGEQITVSISFIRRATARVYLTGFFMLHLFVQKHFPKHKKMSYSNLLTTSHEFLDSELTKMGGRICSFAEHSKNDFNNELKLSFAINQALVFLHDPELELDEQNVRARNVLKRYDWSVTTPVFDLAYACVKRDFNRIIELAEKAFSSGKMGYSDAHTFCVFKEAREIEGFLSCFPRSPLLLECSNDEK